MRSKKRGRRRFATPYHDVGPDRESQRKAANRKARQLCAQVAETLSFVLQAECNDEVLRDVLVEAVEPAPDSTRLLVTVAPSPAAGALDAAQVREHLLQAYGKLRSEVAMAIHRRKVPELVFAVRS
jgi:ribosome-binding factor A